MIKSLKELALDITEEEYRQDSALSYSTLAKYERSGFNGLSNLFDRIDTPSLTFGSAVDSIITGGEEEFNDRFMVADYPSVPDSIISIVKNLFNNFKEVYFTLEEIPYDSILAEIVNCNYQSNWKPETRVKVVKEKGQEYYNLLFLSQGKTILDNNTYYDVINTVEALKTSAVTKWYFEEDSPFNNDIERLYQLKFKATFNGIDYRCMMDEVIVDHTNKKIYLIDLKTSGKKEWEFAKSFNEWSYQIQARLYYRIFKENIEKDEYFKDFKIEPYRFIVVNRFSKIPLIWLFNETKFIGDLCVGKNKDFVWRDPFTIGEELNYYLEHSCEVPIGIEAENDILEWMNKV